MIESMENLSERFFDMVPISLCRQQAICITSDSSGPLQLAICEETRPFVVDTIGRLLGSPLQTYVMDRPELERLIDTSFERYRNSQRQVNRKRFAKL